MRQLNMQSAKEIFKCRVHYWSQKLDVDVAWLGIRPMRRKWASCSTKGRVNFSTELLQKDPKFQDYVIVHELLHLRVPNHGKLFKSLMRAHLGELECVKDEFDTLYREVA